MQSLHIRLDTTGFLLYNFTNSYKKAVTQAQKVRLFLGGGKEPDMVKRRISF